MDNAALRQSMRTDAEYRMGWWGNTTYIAHGDASAVSAALAALFARESMATIAPPAQRQRLRVEPMQYEPALRNDLWGAAIFPGADGWTIVQTAPLELLGERAVGASRMRLADLCHTLGCPAFMLNVYDSTGIVLVESDAAGAISLSGFTLQGAGGDPLRWHGEALDEAHLEARFRQFPYNDLVADGSDGESLAARLAARFGGRNAAFCDNGVSVGTLIEHTPFAADGVHILYARWPGPTRQRYVAAADWNAVPAAATAPD